MIIGGINDNEVSEKTMKEVSAHLASFDPVGEKMS